MMVSLLVLQLCIFPSLFVLGFHLPLNNRRNPLLRFPSRSSTSGYREVILSPLAGTRQTTNENKTVKELKLRLIEACGDRGAVEDIIDQLALRNPTDGAAMSPLLQCKWELIWTTEKEINFFLDREIADQIFQTIEGTRLENLIPFRKGGSFGVAGRLVPSEGLRTEFTFESATLDLQWVRLPLPPVGTGWFDTVFLDDEIRIDRNSRNDILICRRS